MTTSDTNNPSLPAPGDAANGHAVGSGSHWHAMIATLERSQASSLVAWIDDDLSSLEIRLARFSSPHSRSASATGRR